MLTNFISIDNSFFFAKIENISDYVINVMGREFLTPILVAIPN